MSSAGVARPQEPTFDNDQTMTSYYKLTLHYIATGQIRYLSGESAHCR